MAKSNPRGWIKVLILNSFFRILKFICVIINSDIIIHHFRDSDITCSRHFSQYRSAPFVKTLNKDKSDLKIIFIELCSTHLHFIYCTVLYIIISRIQPLTPLQVVRVITWPKAETDFVLKKVKNQIILPVFKSGSFKVVYVTLNYNLLG